MARLYFRVIISLTIFVSTVLLQIQNYVKFVRFEETLTGSVLESWTNTDSHGQCAFRCTQSQKCRAIHWHIVNSTCVLYGNHTFVANENNEESKNVSTYVKELRSCEPGWSVIGNSCYICINISVTWFEAKDECNAMGANLATITSQDENDAVLNVRVDSTLSFWIGGQGISNGTHRNWQWENGEDWDFETFAEGQPNYESASVICLAINPKQTNVNDDKWNDRQCDSSLRLYPFMCEMTIT